MRGGRHREKTAVDSGKFCRRGRYLPGLARRGGPEKPYVSDLRASAYGLQDHIEPIGRGYVRLVLD
jgi:hypothetical protein